MFLIYCFEMFKIQQIKKKSTPALGNVSPGALLNGHVSAGGYIYTSRFVANLFLFSNSVFCDIVENGVNRQLQ